MSSATTGKILKDARNRLGLTQQEVAEQSGIHWNTYAKIERDEQKPSFDTIKKLTKILGLNLKDIPS